jgi:hypothetical protein
MNTVLYVNKYSILYKKPPFLRYTAIYVYALYALFDKTPYFVLYF